MDGNLIDALRYIDPDDYEDWIKVGMALKKEGHSVSEWDAWSSGSTKYKQGVCEKKWNSFNEGMAGEPVSGGTIIQMAKDRGWVPTPIDDGFGWDDEVEEIGRDYKIIDPGFVKEKTLPQPKGKPIDDLRYYLNTLYEKTDYVGYCDRLDFDGERWIPKQGIKSRTAGDLLEDLEHGFEKSTIKSESEGGAMIRFNPLDGDGESDANVSDFRYCLIESDKDSVEKQYALYHEMNLPIAMLVYSGGKSLHAIVRIDAGKDHRTYKERVDFVYSFCEKNGLHVDKNDKNASRYSRMPGVYRSGKLQYIVGSNIGPASYEEWKVWADEQNDNLPKDVSFAEISKNLPPLKEELISGILRVGHKMLIAGPSKAGKSFLLMNLAVCFAEGLEWIGHKCKQGKVLYVNLELDEASCFHRFKEIYSRLGVEMSNADNLTIWNLRGRAVPMDKLTPFLIKRYKGKNYVAIIVDPIYKVITGDENNATDMSVFCSYFDRAAIEINAAMLYCHHHSKGANSKYSNTADRSSGSGVFARDPDAIIDMTQLAVEDSAETRYREQVPDAVQQLSAWEISSTLREFPPSKATRIWFDYPLHRVDEWNFLAEAKYSDMGQRGVGKNQKAKEDIAGSMEMLFDSETFEANEALQREYVIDSLGISESNLKKHTATNTKFESGTLQDGTKVIFRRNNKIIMYRGTCYERPEHKNRPWIHH